MSCNNQVTALNLHNKLQINIDLLKCNLVITF